MVEDEAGDAQLAEDQLRKGGLDILFKRVESHDGFVKELKDFSPDVILSDHGLCAFDSFSALKIAREQRPDVPFIFVTGSLGEEIAAQALKSGASDFILKTHLNGLPPAVHRALREARSQAQRKKAQREILRLNEDLERRVAVRTAELQAANQDLEALSYSVSHELRAPVRQIEGFIELLRENKSATMDEEARQYLTTVATGARRLAQLIDDLLAFYRMARAGMRLGKVSLQGIYESARRELEPEARGRQVEWLVGALPDVRGDAALLHQVLTNLLGNALKYTRRRDCACIEIHTRTTKNEVIVSVKDNGVGFDPRYVGKLFGMFQRLHPRSEFEGSGIGLANVRRIVHQHGGCTWAEGEPGKGATFYFSLPS